MNLLSVTMETMVMQDRVSVEDGYGGFNLDWADGASFQAAVALDDSINAQKALADGVTGVYNVLTPRNVTLHFHDVFRRESDGKIFRVMTDGDDKKTPSSAGLKLRQVRAEEWSLVDG